MRVNTDASNNCKVIRITKWFMKLKMIIIVLFYQNIFHYLKLIRK